MSVDLASWLADLEGAFQEVATSALALDGLEVASRHEVAPALHGAYLGLVGPAGAVQIGIASSPEGCLALAQGLMGMGPGETMPDAEVADAVCEIINIVAGGFKTRLRDRASPLQMGLPVFIRGAIQSTERVAVQVAEGKAGAVPVAMILVHPRQGREA
jgi:CheY-specific phosphatase CheX